MWDKRYPSIFDIFESFAKGFPFERKEKFEEDWFKEPFEDMIKRFEETMPAEFKDLRARRGYVQEAYLADMAPLSTASAIRQSRERSLRLQEFGNIKPSHRGIEPSSGREPLVDVMNEKERYRIFVELPGVDKDKVKLDVAEDSVEIKTDDDKKFYKMIYLDSAVDTDSAKASYKNGVLTLELDKKEKRKGKEVKIE